MIRKHRERGKERKKSFSVCDLRHLFLGGWHEVTYLLAVTLVNKGVL